MKLVILTSDFAICRLASDAPIPPWALRSEFYSVTRGDSELSLVCEEKLVPEAIQAERGWRGLRVAGTLDFSLTGILRSIANPLADAGISIFAVSTFDTDYVFVKKATWEASLTALRSKGFVI